MTTKLTPDLVKLLKDNKKQGAYATVLNGTELGIYTGTKLLKTSINNIEMKDIRQFLQRPTESMQQKFSGLDKSTLDSWLFNQKLLVQDKVEKQLKARALQELKLKDAERSAREEARQKGMPMPKSYKLKKSTSRVPLTGLLNHAPINNVLNEFVGSFLAKNKGGGFADIKRAWNSYMSTHYADVDEHFNSDLLLKAEKVIKTVYSDKRLKKDLLGKSKYNRLTNKIDDETVLGQRLLTTEDKAYFFTDKHVGDKQTAQIAKLFDSLNSDKKQVVVVGPDKINKAFIKPDSVTVNGFTHTPKTGSIGIRAKDWQRSQKSTVFTEKLKHKDGKFYHEQGLVELKAYEQLKQLAEAMVYNYPEHIQTAGFKTTAVVGRGPIDKTKAFEKITVKELKQYSEQLQGNYSSLVEYQGFDDANIAEVLSTKDMANLSKHRDDSLTKKAQETLSKELDSLYNLAERRGISEKAIDTDIIRMNKSSKYMQTGGLDAIYKIKDHLKSATPEAFNRASWVRDGLHKWPDATLEKIIDLSSNGSMINRLHLNDYTAANPLLNLEGNLREDIPNRLAPILLEKAMSGKLETIDPELLKVLSYNMQPDVVDKFKKSLKSTIKKKMLANRGSQLIPKALDIGDAGYKIMDFFGGHRGIEELGLNIKKANAGYDLEEGTNLRIATDAFASGFNLTDQESSESASRRYAELREQQTQQALDYKPSDKIGAGDLRDFSLKQLRDKAMTETANSTGVNTKDFEAQDILKAGEEYKAKLKLKGLSPQDAKDMLSIADKLGYVSKSYGKDSLKQTADFLVNYANASISSEFGDIDTGGNLVKVSLTNSLMDRLFKQDKQGYDKSFGKHKPGLVRFVSNNHADWAPLFEVKHGKGMEGFQLLMGATVTNTRRDLMSILDSIDYLDTTQLKDYYSKTNMVTNYDLKALEQLQEHTTYVKGSNGNTLPRVDSSAGVKDIIHSLSRSYNLNSFFSSNAKDYFGVEAKSSKSKGFRFKKNKNDRYVAPSMLTKYRNNQALVQLATSGNMPKYQSLAGHLVPDKTILTRLNKSIKSKFRDILEYQNYSRRLEGKSGLSNKAQQEVLSKMEPQLKGIFKLLDGDITSGNYQTLQSRLKGLQVLDNTLSNRYKNSDTLSTTRLFEDIQSGKFSIKKEVDRVANSDFRNRATKFAELLKFNLADLGIEYNPFDVAATNNLGKAILNGMNSGVPLNNKAISTRHQQLVHDYATESKKDNLNVREASKSGYKQKPSIRAKKQIHKLKPKNMTRAWKQKPIGPFEVFNPETARISSKPVLRQPHKFNNQTRYNYNLLFDEPFKQPSKYVDLPYKVPSRQAPKRLSQSTKDLTNYESIYDVSFDEPSLRYKPFTRQSDFTLGYKKPLFLNAGGKLKGKGTKDEVPALLTKGEVVLDRGTSEILGIETQADYHRFKKAVANGKISKFEDGGLAENLSSLGDNRFNKLKNINSTSNFPDLLKEFKTILTTVRASIVSGAKLTDKQLKLVSQFDHIETNKATKIADIDMTKTVKQDEVRTKNDTRRNKYWSSPEGDIGDIHLNASTLIADINSGKLNIKDFDNLTRVEKDTLLDSKSNGVDSLATNKAKSRLNLEQMASKFKMTYEELLPFTKLNNLRNNLSFGDIDEGARAKFKSIDADTYDQALKSYATPSQRSSLNQATKATFPKHTSETTTSKITTRLNANADILKDILGLNFSNAKNTADVHTIMKGYNADKVKLDNSGQSTVRLRQKENALSDLSEVLGRDEFSGLGRERAQIQDVKQRTSRARSIREGAEGRYSEFAALTAQNFAFGASYALIGGVQSAVGGTIGFVANFDDAMKNLQAITGETSEGLDTMSEAVKKVSVETKFSALDIAQAGTILGQAGFSATDIDKSLGGVVQLATATGSGLEESTQVLTSALTIWDKSIADSGKYANQFTAAVNESKLDINALALTLQYAGNIASSADIPIEDVTTLTSLLKDAGIKRGSTLGTGQRLLYSDIANPSKKFADSLKTTGISLSKFNEAFADRGLYGALTLMKDSGYGLAQATKGMELREKSIYTAAINQLDQFEGFRDSITGTNAAFVANQTQMEGVGNSFKNMLNSWQINLNESFDSSKGIIGKAFKAMTIGIDSKSPKDNLAVKGYSIDDRNKPETPGFSLLQATAAVGASGFLGNSIFKNVLATSKGNIARANLSEIIPQGYKTSAIKPSKLSGLRTTSNIDRLMTRSDNYMKALPTKIDKAFGGVFKSLSKHIRPGSGSLATISAAGALGAATADDNSRVSGALDLASIAGSGILADKYVDKMYGAKSKHAGVKKIGIGLALNWFDSAVVKPARESDNGYARTAGAIGTGLEAGATALAVTKNPYIAIGTTIAGAILAGISKRDAPKADTTETMSAITNDMKAINSEFDSLIKGASGISSVSNFAMRPGKDADLLEKTAKYNLVIEELNSIDKSAPGLQEALKQSSKGSFQGFDLASSLMDPSKNDIETDTFNVKKFIVDGTSITSTDRQVKGINAVDAAAITIRSATEAAYKAFKAEGGAGETLLNNLNNTDLAKFTAKLNEGKTVEQVVATNQSESINPNVSFIKENPALALQNKSLLKEGRLNTDKLTRQRLSLVSKDKKKDLEAFDIGVSRREAQIESVYSKSATMAKIPVQIEDIIAEQTKQFILKGNYTDKTKALNDFKDTKEARLGEAAYVKTVKDFSGSNNIFNRLADGLNKIEQADIKAIDLSRKLTNNTTKAINHSIMQVGTILTQDAIDIATSLAEPVNNLDHSLKKQISKLGDLTNISSKDYLDSSKNSVVLNKGNKKLFNQHVTSKEELTVAQEKQLRANLTGRNNSSALVSLNKIDLKSLDNISSNLAAKYKQAELSAKSFSSTVLSARSTDDSNITNNYGLLKAVKGLELNVKKIGLRDLNAYQDLRTLDVSRNNLKIMGSSSLTDLLSTDKVRQLDDSKSKAIENLDISVKQAKIEVAEGKSISTREIGINYSQQQAKLDRNINDTILKSSVSYVRGLSKINTNAIRSFYDASKNYTRQLDKLNTNYDRQLDAIDLKYDRNVEDLATRNTRSLEALDTSKTRKVQDLETKRIRSEIDLVRKSTRALEALDTDRARKQEDLDKSNSRGLTSIDLKGTRGKEDINLKGVRGREDIARNTNYSLQDLGVKEDRAYEDMATSENRGRQDLKLKFDRANADIATGGIRGTDDLNTGFNRSIDNLNISLARSRSDATKAKARNTYDSNINSARAISDALTKFNDNLLKINTNYTRALESISRSRSDTVDAFNRSLDRPQVVSLTPGTLTQIANNLGDVTLALDAHKAELTANTTAVKQNTLIQKTSEDLAKEAYKDAYKTVGGNVYNSSGEINQDFITAYDDYMNTNSDKLIDAVLENAVNKAFAGSGFNINTAMTDADYIAQAVNNPTPEVTTNSIVQSNSSEELIKGLYGVQAGEVRVTSTAGIILDAQGGMEGALYDLDSALIQVGIKLREANIGYQQNLEDAALVYEQNLRDIDEANKRKLEDIELSYARALEDLTEAETRKLEDANLANQRATDDLIEKLSRQQEDLDLSKARANEDLAISLSRAGDNLQLSLDRAGEDLELTVNRSYEQLELSLTRAGEDLNISLDRAGEDLSISIAQAGEDLNLSMARAGEDLDLVMAQAREDLAISLTRAGEDLRLSVFRAGEDLDLQFQQAGADLNLALARGMNDAALNFSYGITDAALGLSNAFDDIALAQARQQADALVNFEQALTDIQTKYSQDKRELNISFNDSLDKVDRGVADALKKIERSEANSLNNITKQFDDSVISTIQALSDWNTNFERAFNDGVKNKIWDLSKGFVSIESSINNSLSKMEIDSSEIVRGVNATFKAAFNGEGLKEIGRLAGEDVQNIFKKALSNIDEPIKTTADNIDKAIRDNFGTKLSKTTNDIFNTIAKDIGTKAEELSTQGNLFKDAVKIVPDALDNLLSSDSYSESLKLLNTSISKSKNIGIDAKTAASTLDTGINNLKTSITNYKTSVNDMNTLGLDVVTAANNVSFDVNSSIPTVTTAMTNLSDGLISAAGIVVRDLAAAKASAQVALAIANTPAGHSTGYLVPGYGGGDTELALLEPGEIVIRKEIVRQFGADYFMNLNNDSITTQSVIPGKTEFRLPANSSTGINVNIGITADTSTSAIESNMELIADGVKRIFEEYS